ncbi:unnamed protein product [Caenorhabditis auriculariae]|uniref:Glycoprotein hormone subunit beta domain-containing protein n=1 Tax=Caenorhabditis auriculariae TaxID=2777116 RepID=A0A8S1HUH0_9PELO|nr:unnamed protein product [Caenorhabditis auriculariae]
MSIFLLLFGIFIKALECSKECELSLQTIPGFNPYTQHDSDGKACRGTIELPLCRGYCKTSESGTHTFPPRQQNSSACVLVETSKRKVELKDCDEGAADAARFVEIPHGTVCECKSLPLDTTQPPV